MTNSNEKFVQRYRGQRSSNYKKGQDLYETDEKTTELLIPHLQTIFEGKGNL